MVGLRKIQSSGSGDGDAMARQPGPAVTRPVEDSEEGLSHQLARAAQQPYLPDNSSRTAISPSWHLIAVAYFVASVLAMAGSWSVPPLPGIAGLVTAIVLSASARRLAGLECGRGECKWRSLAKICLLVSLPMALFGASMAWWAEAGQANWGVAIAALLFVSAIAGVIQAARRHMLLIVELPLWATVALVDGDLAGIVALLLAIPFAVIVSRCQIEILREQREKAEADARLQRRALDILRDVENTGQSWFWETDRRGNLTYVSAPICRVLGRSRKQLHGRPFTDLFDLSDNQRAGERTLAFHLSSRASFQELAVRAAVRDERWWSITGRPVHDSFDNFVGFRGSGHDLTEKKRSQEQASRLAHYDSLTGLANRLQMSQTLEKLLSAPLEMHRECSVFLLDLDRFKQVNDTMGHPAGDTLLEQVAQRLERAIGTKGQVGRLGGDEFKVIIPGHTERAELADLAKDVIASLSQPYSIEGHRVVIGASVGIALAPKDGETSEELIRNADLALYAAKDGGRGGYHFYADDLHKDAEERRQMEQDLRDAMHNGALELHYQPVIHTATEKIAGFEALLRWHHPVKGAISPSSFVNVAEDTGLISAIGEWALRTACHDLARWPEEVRVAVNVSPLQFANPQLPAIVTSAIAQAGIAPDRLELEITESVFLDDNANIDAMFAALKRVGVRLALDDFGTGYSSLGYLKKAPFDKIKIDQSFVRGATKPGSRNGAIIASITSLAQALGMDTTAEGVETLDELDLVRLHGCSHVQGFIYEKALSASAATQRLATGLAAVAQGPRSARAPRQTMLRKVVLEHGGQHYNGTIRNISVSGALVEGLWNVPPGTVFKMALTENHEITVTARWCEDNRMGVQFDVPLQRDASGNFTALSGAEHARHGVLRKAG